MEVVETEAFIAWFEGLRDLSARIRLGRRLRRLRNGQRGDVAAVGSGVFEMREHYGPGYRIYYLERGTVVVVLLCGGDKSSQARDIKRAKAMAEELTA